VGSKHGHSLVRPDISGVLAHILKEMALGNIEAALLQIGCDLTVAIARQPRLTSELATWRLKLGLLPNLKSFGRWQSF
jgi:hypothetical protein